MKYRVETTVTTYAFSVYLELEKNSISMSYDGSSSYKSTDIIEADTELNVFMRINGLNGSSWELKVIVMKDDDAEFKKELKDIKGIINSNQTVSIEKKLKLS